MSPVKANRPQVYGLHPQVCFVPRVARQCGPDGVLRLCLDGVHHPLLIGERPTQDEEAGFDESVEERGVRAKARLLLQRPRPIPLGSRPAKRN